MRHLRHDLTRRLRRRSRRFARIRRRTATWRKRIPSSTMWAVISAPGAETTSGPSRSGRTGNDNRRSPPQFSAGRAVCLPSDVEASPLMKHTCLLPDRDVMDADIGDTRNASSNETTLVPTFEVGGVNCKESSDVAVASKKFLLEMAATTLALKTQHQRSSYSSSCSRRRY